MSATAKERTSFIHNIISLVMAKTQRTNGNWGEQQRNELHGLLSTNQVNHRNRQPDYVWQVCNLKPFKEFISDGKNGKASAIKRMKDCFLRYEEGTLLKGARKNGMYFFLLITLFRHHSYPFFPLQPLRSSRCGWCWVELRRSCYYNNNAKLTCRRE